MGRDAWVRGSPPTHPTCPPSPGSIWEVWVHPHSNSYLLHATVHKGALAWPGGAVHHDALSELRFLILTHVVRAVQGVQESCGWEGVRGVQKHMGVWQGTLVQGPALSQTASCHQTGLLCLGLFSQLSSNFSGSGNDPWEMGVRPSQALPANCRSWCLGKNAFLRYLVKDTDLRKFPGRPALPDLYLDPPSLMLRRSALHPLTVDTPGTAESGPAVHMPAPSCRLP